MVRLISIGPTIVRQMKDKHKKIESLTTRFNKYDLPRLNAEIKRIQQQASDANIRPPTAGEIIRGAISRDLGITLDKIWQKPEPKKEIAEG